jgi:hypothetical protein
METEYKNSWPSSPSRNVVCDDFSSVAALATKYTYTQILSGTAAIQTVAAGRSGTCLFSSVDATANKGAQLQAAYAPQILSTGKDTRFGARLKVSKASNSALIAGLAIVGSAVIGTPVSDGIYFSMSNGSANLNITGLAGSASIFSLTGVQTLSDDTFLDIAFQLTNITAGNAGLLLAFVNGIQVANVAVSGLPTSAVLVPTLAFNSGDATIRTMTLDAWMADQAR